ncbi:MAG: hypothetical protein AAGF92_05780 [Myxococcota bacterium]
MRFARGVFYFEALSNLGSAGFAMFAPGAFLGQFTSEPIPAGAVEIGRWYALLLVVLSLVLLAALREGTDRFLRPVIAAFLLGDVLQIAVAVRLGMVSGSSFAVHAAIWTSAFYALVRVYYLRRSNPTMFRA